MKSIFQVIFFVFLLQGFCSAQLPYDVKNAIDFFRQNKLSKGEWKNTLSESDIEGSPYQKDEFINGSVYTLNKQKFTDIPLRYNVFNDAIEFKASDGQVLAMDAPELVEKVEFDGKTMVYLPFSNLKKIRKGFFVVLEEGRASLYLKSEIMFKDAIAPAAYKDAEPPRFVKKPDTFYIKIGTEQAKLVDNKNEIPDFFPEKREQIGIFIKKNKTKINSEDLIELVKYYNSL